MDNKGPEKGAKKSEKTVAGAVKGSARTGLRSQSQPRQDEAGDLETSSSSAEMLTSASSMSISPSTDDYRIVNGLPVAHGVVLDNEECQEAAKEVVHRNVSSSNIIESNMQDSSSVIGSNDPMKDSDASSSFSEEETEEEKERNKKKAEDIAFFKQCWFDPKGWDIPQLKKLRERCPEIWATESCAWALLKAEKLNWNENILVNQGLDWQSWARGSASCLNFVDDNIALFGDARRAAQALVATFQLVGARIMRALIRKRSQRLMAENEAALAKEKEERARAEEQQRAARQRREKLRDERLQEIQGDIDAKAEQVRQLLLATAKEKIEQQLAMEDESSSCLPSSASATRPPEKEAESKVGEKRKVISLSLAAPSAKESWGSEDDNNRALWALLSGREDGYDEIVRRQAAPAATESSAWQQAKRVKVMTAEMPKEIPLEKPEAGKSKVVPTKPKPAPVKWLFGTELVQMEYEWDAKVDDWVMRGDAFFDSEGFAKAGKSNVNNSLSKRKSVVFLDGTRPGMAVQEDDGLVSRKAEPPSIEVEPVKVIPRGDNPEREKSPSDVALQAAVEASLKERIATLERQAETERIKRLEEEVARLEERKVVAEQAIAKAPLPTTLERDISREGERSEYIPSQLTKVAVPEKFVPNSTVDACQWLEKFQTSLRLWRLPEKEWGKILHLYVHESYQEVVSSWLDKPWEEVVKNFENRFLPKDYDLILDAELQKLKQSPKELVRDYCERFHSLWMRYIRVRSRTGTSLDDKAKVRQCLQGLRTELRLKGSELGLLSRQDEWGKFVTLAESLEYQLASQAKVWQDLPPAEKKAFVATSMGSISAVMLADAHGVDEKEGEETAMKVLLQKQDALSKSFQSFHRQMTNNNSKTEIVEEAPGRHGRRQGGRVPATAAGARDRNRSPELVPDVQCFTCRKWGHYKGDCPSDKNSSGPGKGKVCAAPQGAKQPVESKGGSRGSEPKLTRKERRAQAEAERQAQAAAGAASKPVSGGVKTPPRDADESE